jgi:hypothetical protein
MHHVQHELLHDESASMYQHRLCQLLVRELRLQWRQRQRLSDDVLRRL